MTISRHLAACALLALCVAPARAGEPLPLPEYSMATPSLFAGSLYTDLSGALRAPGVEQPPLWWFHMTGRLAALHDRLASLDAQAGTPSIRYDWLCQCSNPRHMRLLPTIIVEQRSESAARLRVRVTLNGADTQELELLLVNDDGWLIDDIVDERGRHYSEKLAAAIDTHLRGRTPLPDRSKQ